MQVGGSMIEDPVLAAEARHDYLQSERPLNIKKIYKPSSKNS